MSQNTEKPAESDQPPTATPSDQAPPNSSKQPAPVPSTPVPRSVNLRPPALRNALQEALKELGHEL